MRRILFAVLAVCVAQAWGQSPQKIADYLSAREKMMEVTPDSIFPTIRQLERMRTAAKDSVTWAMLSECLGEVYERNTWMAQHDATGEKEEEWGRGQWQEASKRCFEDARKPLNALRRTKAKAWQPLVRLFKPKAKKDSIVGSQWFDDDLLHIIHRERPTESVARYYAESVGGNAAILARLWMNDVTKTNIDSLLNEAEADKTVSDEVRAQVAIERMRLAHRTDNEVAIGEEILERYGHLAICNQVRNTLERMRQPSLNYSFPDRVYPGRTFRVPVTYNNIREILVTIGKETIAIPAQKAEAHVTVRDTLTLMAPQTGRYHVSVQPRTDCANIKPLKPDTCTLYVSALRLLRLTAPKAAEQRFIVVDAISGAPVGGHKVETYVEKTKRGRRDHERRMVRIAGDPQPGVEYWNTSDYAPSYGEHTYTKVYTDRAIYRPGQKVGIALVRYKEKHWQASTVEGEELIVTVNDNEGKDVFRDTLKTDRFGSASTEFVVPAKARLGHYSVDVKGGYASFRVEEYKRPTFAIEMGDTLRGDTMTATVRSYNGTPLRNTCVTGSYSLRTYWWRVVKGDQQTIDTLWTDAEGRVEVPLRLPQGEEERRGKLVDVKLVATSPTGETQDASHVYVIGKWEEQTEANSMPRDTIAWFKALNDTIFADKPARIEVGSAARDVHLFMTMFRNSERIAEREIVFSDSLLTLEFGDTLIARYPDCDGVSVSLAFMKDERVYSQSYVLHRPLPDNCLRWTWESFRDHVKPGGEEEWTGRLLTPDGRAAKANAIFSIYDASLDAFVRHTMTLNLWRGHNVFSATYANMFSATMHQRYIYSQIIKELREPYVGYHSFSDRFRLDNVIGGMGMYSGYARPTMLKEMVANVRVRGAAKAMAVEESVMADYAASNEAGEAESQADGSTEEEKEAVPMRENFSETALFVPTLRTDKDGRITMRFTLPDAVTTWRVLGVAHTEDMMIANIEAEAVAQKPLMAMVDVPRYLREGDKGTATVRVQNISGRAQTVTLAIDIVDAETEKVVKTDKRQFTLTADTVFACELDASWSKRLCPLIVRAVVKSAEASDGEQRQVPVIEAAEWYTRSADLVVRKAGKHTFNVGDLLSETAMEQRVTVQYTQSPVWTAVDVLRNIAKPKHDDAISLHTALYASTLTRHLVATNSAVADYLQLDSDSLDATIKSLGERLDGVRAKEGGYGWFPGFDASEWITLEVATTFARLKEMTGKESPSLAYALEYLRECNDKRVERMRRDSVRYVSQSALQYLYVTALAGAKMDKNTHYVLDLLTDECKSPAKLTREQMAIATVILERLGQRTIAADVRKEMRRHLVTTAEHGTSFSYLRGSFTSIDRKLLDHVYAMEALAQGDTLLPEMRRHLLQQKRVQAWENPLVNSSAVYALMMGSEYQTVATTRDRLVVGEKVMEVRDGRVREQLQMTAMPTSVTIEKTADGESWGAIYVEQRQTLADIGPHSTGLDVRRYVEGTATVGATGQTRLVIHADRDYECVHVHVGRPACVEPVNALSRRHWQGGLAYYHEVHDAADDLFIERLPKGDYVLTLPAYAVRRGTYNAGLTTISCLYAPEFCANTANEQVGVE
ncbi:MAG: hypothetical protein HUK01_08835 [Bacteroidaceae bacterium]|nr:hypothetical protein [Bacteroidaceae bacterium]